MSMKARVQTDSFGNITIHMEGDLNYDNTTPLRRELEELTAQNPHSEITLNLLRLDFVGSSGINHFVETIEALNQKRKKIRLSGVSDEFIKVFRLYKLNALEEIIENFDNDETEIALQNTKGKKMTFQN